MKKCYPPLLNELTNQGYKPEKLLSSLGLSSLASTYIRKKITKKFTGRIDYYKILEAYNLNKSFFYNIPINAEYYNKSILDYIRKSENWYMSKDEVITSLSTNWYISIL